MSQAPSRFSLKLVPILLLVIPALAVLIHGPRGNENIPSGRVVIDYWEKWGGNEAEQMQQIVTDFNNSVGVEKNIYVRYISTSSVNQKTLVATAAGVPPDIAGLWHDNTYQFAELDALEPLDDLAAEHGISEKTYKPVYWDACHYKGKLYALVSNPACIALHYNKKAFLDNADVLKAAGLDATRPPKTLDELDAYAKALEVVNKDGSIQRDGYLPMEPGWYVNCTYMWFGAKIWDEKSEKFTFTSPEVVRAFAWLQSYSKRLGKDATVNFQSGLGNFDSPQNAFLANTVMMEQQGPWMANYILNLKPEMAGVAREQDEDISLPAKFRQDRAQWAAAAFPSAVPGVEDASYCPFDTLVIPRGSKHKREAFEFIAFVNRRPVMEKLCNLHSANSPLNDVSLEFVEHHKNPYINVFEKLARSPNAQCTPKIAILPEMIAELNNTIQAIARLRGEPKDLLQDLQDRMQARYDHFMEIQKSRRAVQ